MRIPPQIEQGANSTVLVLSVSPFSEDHVRLREILVAASNCVLITCDTLVAAARQLERNQFAVVISEYDLSVGSWRDVLTMMSATAAPPSLLISSRLADERKWSEILNLGAFDLLIKPFVAEEVCRVVNAAWRHWHRQNNSEAERPRLRSVGAA